MTGARHFVLAAGGTGGHIIPAFALATELRRRGHHVALVTDERGAAIFFPPGASRAIRSDGRALSVTFGPVAQWRGAFMRVFSPKR
jgi:UDP-N-acetylglucosamine--N-acetylmuramyl-(pentapeptide) pyrophosphoryl-undecaprenol N-acetylglucosamine transferase